MSVAELDEGCLPGASTWGEIPLVLGDGWHVDRPGGLNRYVADLIGALEDLGSRPRCIVLGPGEDAPDSVTTAGHRLQLLPLRLWQFCHAAVGAGREADVVDAHFALTALLPVVFGPLRRKPLVVHFQGPWADEGAVQGENRRRSVVKRAIERPVYHRAARVIVLSYAFKRLLVERYAVAPWRIAVVPPGVDLDAFRPGDGAEARVRLGLPAEKTIVLTVRRLVPRMGIDVLLEAWAQLGPDPDGVLVVVGQGQERANLEAQAARLGIQRSVRFLGRVDEAKLLDCYQAADMVVLPSVALEGFGLTALEALACGAPVIATTTGGLPEVLSGLDPTLIVPAGDAQALASRIAEARAGALPLPDAGRCRAHAESFSWHRAGVRHQAIYADAANPAPRLLRVVYLDHCALLSGGELALLRLLPALDEIDAHVVLAQDGPLVPKLLQAGVSVEVLPMSEQARDVHRAQVRLGRLPILSAVRTMGYTIRLARHLRRLRPDIVHTNSLKSAVYGGVAGRLAGIPVVWHVRDRIADDYLPPTAVRVVKALAERLPTAIIGNSRATLDALGATNGRQTVVPSPVGLVATPARRVPATEGPIAPRRFRVGIVGRLAPWKGQHLFLDAFARAFPEPTAEAVIIGAALFGEQDYADKLAAQVTGLGLQDRVDFRGFRDDMAAELGRLDVVVHASVTAEPFGQVVVEAMALGVPVVAANAGGPAEIVEHEVTGLLFPPGDVEALGHALVRLASDPVLRRRLRAAGPERARDFRPEVVAPMVMGVYTDVLDSR